MKCSARLSPADVDVRAQPDHRAGGQREHHGPPEHEQGAIDQGRVERLPHPGRPVRGQLQTEGAHLALEHGARQRPADDQRQHDPEQGDARDRRRSHDAGEVRRHQAADEERGDQELRGPAAIAEGEVVRDDGDQPFARAVDDAGGHDAGGVAAEAHHRGHGLFAVGAGDLEEPIRVERHPRQVAEVLEQREQREEDRHRRQHHADDPGRGQVHAVDHDAAQPPGNPIAAVVSWSQGG